MGGCVPGRCSPRGAPGCRHTGNGIHIQTVKSLGDTWQLCSRIRRNSTSVDVINRVHLLLFI